MFQRGYLTIEGYSPASKHYQLGFPNQEVREAFTKFLVKHFAKLDVNLSTRMEAMLEEHELATFFDEPQKTLSSCLYRLFSKATEQTYHGFVLSLLSGMELK